MAVDSDDSESEWTCFRGASRAGPAGGGGGTTGGAWWGGEARDTRVDAVDALWPAESS